MCEPGTIRLLERVFSGVPWNPELGKVLCVPAALMAGPASFLCSLPAPSCQDGPNHSCCNSRLGGPFPPGPVATSQGPAIARPASTTTDCTHQRTFPFLTLTYPSGAFLDPGWTCHHSSFTGDELGLSDIPGLLHWATAAMLFFDFFFFKTAICVFLIFPARLSNQGLSRCQHLILICKSG